MPVYKDEERNTWYVKLSYTDYTGRTRQKMKRGFQLRRDAQQWEREFLEQMSGTPDMTFKTLSVLFMEDYKRRCKDSSVRTAASNLKYILPIFGSRRVNEIRPSDVLQWKNYLVNDTGLSAGTIHRVDGTFRSILHFAEKYYGLKVSPAAHINRAGSSKSPGMKFYTLEQFNAFIETFREGTRGRMIFNLLFYTGIRVGELLALTAADVNLEEKTLSISKTWDDHLKIATAPKTDKSNRTIALTAALCDELRQYMGKYYDLQPEDNIFPVTGSAIRYMLKSHARRAELPEIRVHDLRHSHASLLIDMGIPPAVIADRLGHESTRTTLEVYGHLYPNKQRLVADALEELNK